MRWFWLLIGYFLSQVAIQALGFFGGIVILRSMSKSEYAIYTIVNSFSPILLMLSDMGIGTGLGAVGRKIWQDNEQMGSLVQTGLTMRRMFALVSFTLLSPVLLWMLLHNHAPLGTSLILIAIIFATTWAQLTGSVMRMVLQLRQQLNILKNVGLVTTSLRVGLILAFAGLLILNSELAVLAAAFAILLETYLFIRYVKPQIQWGAAPNAEYKSAVLSLVRRTAPLTIYYCIQSQVSVWLISIFGSAHQVADIGAVSRIGMIFILFSSIYVNILIPRFARSNGRRLIRIRYFQVLATQFFPIGLVVLLVKLYPAPLLWLLGPKYADVGGILWLVVLSTGLGAFLGLTVGMNNSKGWVPPAVISIPLEVATQIVLLLTLDLSKTQNVLIFSCLSVIPPVIFTIWYGLIHINREEP
jgi:O-antigen/teichoic acid export membrane protein